MQRQNKKAIKILNDNNVSFKDFSNDQLSEMNETAKVLNTKSLERCFNLKSDVIFALLSLYNDNRFFVIVNRHEKDIAYDRMIRRLLLKAKHKGLTKYEFAKQYYCESGNIKKISEEFDMKYEEVMTLRNRYRFKKTTSDNFSFKNVASKILGVKKRHLIRLYKESNLNRKEIINQCYHIKMQSGKEPKFFSIYDIPVIDKQERYRRKMLIESKHNLEKYGYENVRQVPEFIDKMHKKKNAVDNKTGLTSEQISQLKSEYHNEQMFGKGIRNQFQRPDVLKNRYGKNIDLSQGNGIDLNYYYEKAKFYRLLNIDKEYFDKQFWKVYNMISNDETLMNIDVLCKYSDCKFPIIWIRWLDHKSNNSKEWKIIHSHNASRYEKEMNALLNDLKNNGIINDFFVGQRIFKGLDHKKWPHYAYHVDFYIPDLRLAFELNPTWTHMKEKNYHLTKTLMSEELGISLIHIYQTELDNHDWKDIVNDAINKRKGGYVLISDHDPKVIERSRDARFPDKVVWNEGNTEWIKESKINKIEL